MTGSRHFVLRGHSRATVTLLIALALVALGGTARAAGPTPNAPAYGQVAAIGGFDTGAKYNLSLADPVNTPSTTDPASLTPGKFVYPVGMAVDNDAASVPGGTAIYVLDLLNPQEFDNAASDEDNDTVELQYRIQELAINPANGSEVIENSTVFTLNSSATTPSLQAVALAVDHAEDRVDVLLDDWPDTFGTPNPFQVSVQVDEWPLSLSGAPTTVVPATTLEPNTGFNGSKAYNGDLDGTALAFAGTGTSAQLVVGGTQYSAGPGSGKQLPTLEQFSQAGAPVKTWQGDEAAANSVARAFGEDGLGGTAKNAFATPQALYGVTANPDGTLNVTLGPQNWLGEGLQFQTAETEPMMATVSANLATTTPILPSPHSLPSDPDGFNQINPEVAATVAVSGDQADGATTISDPGGSEFGGSLGPSVVALDGGSSLPAGLYAGFVADDLPGVDGNLDQFGSSVNPPAWTAGNDFPIANYGVRIFDGGGSDPGEPLGMVGNQTLGAVCSLSGGSATFTAFNSLSVMALAAGQDGTFYALVQPDLTSANDPSSVDPNDPVNPSGDKVIEFGPASGTACPQPSGDFTASDSLGLSDSSSAPIVVDTGTTVDFDASSIDLAGGVPWSYSWDLDNGKADGLSASGFTYDDDAVAWVRGTPTTQFTYNTPGTFDVTLQLLNDFGTDTVSRQVTVQTPGAIDANVAGPATAVAGQPVSFTASGTLGGAGDRFTDFHWDFGDGTSDDSGGPHETWVYQHAGTFTVTVTAHDLLGQSATATQQITVSAPPPPPPAPPSSSPAPTTTAPPAGTTPVAHKADRSPTSVSPQAQPIHHTTAVKVALACPVQKVSCAGTVVVRTWTAVGPSHKVLVIGEAKFSLKGSRRANLILPLSKPIQKLLVKQHSLRLRVIVTAHDSFGDAKKAALSLYLYPPPSGKPPRRFG